MSRKSTGLALAVLSSATFGLVPLFTVNLLHGGMTPDSLVFYRMLFAWAIMLVFLLFKKTGLRLKFREGLTAFLVASLYAATSIFLTSSYQLVPSGIATTIHFLYPMVVSLILVLFFKEKVSLSLFLATVIAITGVYLLSGAQSSGDISIKGLLMVLVTVFTYGTYIVAVNKTRCRNIDSAALTFYVLLFSSLYLFAYNLIAKGGHFDPIRTVSDWVNVILLALIPTVLSNFSLVLAIQRVGSNITAILGCMEPLTAVIVGMLVFNERLDTVQFLGGAAIIFSVLLVLLQSSRSRK